jgi:hypothetical protein
MPLGEPPARHRLWQLPAIRLGGRTLWRCHRAGSALPARRAMWWFASSAPGPSGGRFDLPPPHGSCYTATSLTGAVVEAFQEHWGGGSVMPATALASRVVSSATVPGAAAPAANLSQRRCLAAGVTAALWADRDRTMTKRWAVELHGAGHQAIHHGVQHDPGGRLRGVTLFDAAGAHDPWGLAWPEPASISGHDRRVVAVLAARGVHVTGHRPTLPIIEPAE